MGEFWCKQCFPSPKGG